MGMGGMGNMGGMGMGGMMPGMMGGMGMSNEAQFMQQLGMGQQPQAQLQILLPSTLLQQFLIPRGIMAEICQKCNVRMDLGAEVPQNQRQICISGTIVANSMAVLLLQERSALFNTPGNSSVQ